MNLFLGAILHLVTWCMGVQAQAAESLPAMQLMHRAVLDQAGDYVMLWTPQEDEIIFEVQVATQGYVGLGFSPNGGMKDADIIMGWVAGDGKAVVQDRYAVGYKTPDLDDSQDVKLLGGLQNKTHTVLRFSRKWKSCDEMDFTLSGDTVRIIWAIGETDPVNGETFDRHTKRGTKSMYLKEPQFVLPKFSKDVETWDVLSPNVTLPNNLTTLYWCKLVKMPPVTNKTHMIGYVPVIQEGNHQHVHHIIIYECHIENSARHYEKWLGVKGAQCFGANMPVSWTRCSNPIVAWAIGGDGELMPENVGLPIGEEHGGATYFMMEIHYDNPNLKGGVVDSSGIRIFHTKKLREQEAGILMLGHSVSPFQIVPPNTEWLSVGHCDSSCTEKELPKDGINVFQGILHAHLLGREISLRHIRGGKELPTQFKDANYDFNYQQVRRLKDEMTILPGDFLVTECKYDASKRSVPTFGGFGTEEEMCLIFLTYYPRVNLSVCVSQPALDEILDGLDVEDVYNKENLMKAFADEGSTVDEEAETKLAEEMGGDTFKPRLREVALSQMLRGVIAKSPEKYANMSLYDILHGKATWEEGVVNHLQKEVEHGEHVGFCARRDSGRMFEPLKEEVEYPEFEVFKPDMDECRSERQAESSEESVGKHLPDMSLMHRAVLDQKGEFVMLWTPGEEDIIFEVQAATKGYIGLGFSPNGGMKGADIVLGWVTDDGKVMMQDRYATGYTVPMKDSSQDVKLLGGYENETHTVLRFSRPWTSCDEDDFTLSGDTVRLIWAIGNDDPSGEDMIKMHDKRGSKSMFLKEPQFSLPDFGEDVKTWDVMSPEVTLPNNLTTLYWCKLFKLPELKRKNHMIGYIPVIQEGNHQHVHHVLIYECHIKDSARHYEKWLDVKGAQCFGANMPVSWTRCSNPIVAWAIGGDGELMPENVGLPLGEEHGGATYFLMEIHYDNPNLKEGVVDSSGIRIFHTEKLREQEAGIIMLGHSVSPFQMVPPNTEWLSVGHCDSSCTEKELPKDGINVFQGLLHAHLLGKEITLRQIRGGKELPTQFKDANYDFNYQQVRRLKDEMTILPGDFLVTECKYDASKKSVPTFGGFGTEEEMCLIFLTYYPRVNLSVCVSQPALDELLDGLEVEDIYNKEMIMKRIAEEGSTIDEEAETKMAEEMGGDNYKPRLGEVALSQMLRGVIAKSPQKYANMSLYDILHDKATWEEGIVNHLQKEVERGEHVGFCMRRDTERMNQPSKEEIEYPEFEVFKPNMDGCRSESQAESSEGSVGMPPPEMTLMHRAVLDQKGEFVMLWTPGEEDIVFEVQAATKGYIGLGFSPNGGMKGADIVLGWVTDDGKVMMQDRYATGYTVPMKDSSQDVKLLGGYQNESHTVLRFSRPWTSCDEDDFTLSGDTVRLIWAIGNDDPSGEDMIKMHGKRGSKSMFLKEPQFSLPDFGEDVKTWDVMSPEVALPNNLTTLYWCKLFKLPELKRKNHMIGYIPVIQEGNHQHVHHVLIYECHIKDSARHYEKWLDVKGAQCFGANMPVSWTRCSNPIVAWAIGGDGELMPENVGLPLGEEHGGATYFLMEIHYDNPNLKEGVVDSSGIRIFHTEKLREQEAGIIMLGHSVSPFQMVPPNTEWLSVGHCDSSCTEKELPKDGINVFQGLLHAHLLGKEITLRQIRGGKELPTQFKDANYDFNYQQVRRLKDEMTILPGDFLVTECKYDASKKSVPTFGGFGTEEEMCLIFLTYYPRVNLSVCVSQPALDELLDGLDVEDIYNKEMIMKKLAEEGSTIDEEAETKMAEEMGGDNYKPRLGEVALSQMLRGVIAKSPQKYANMSLYDILHDKATWEEGIVNHLQKEVERGEHVGFCMRRDTERMNQPSKEEIEYPEFEVFKPNMDGCRSESQAESSEGSVGMPPPEMTLMHRAVLDQKGEFVMLWTPGEEDIVFEVQAATKGYIGLGFSPNGGMKGADIVLGWVTDDGKVMMQDRYATGYTVPMKDSSQDVKLLGGYENETHTVLRFSRPWTSCDEDDFTLSGDTVRLIWAIGNDDPSGEDMIKMHDKRGSKSMFLKEPQFSLPDFGEDVKTWDVMSPEVTLPNNLTTLYWCKLFKLPELKRKNHMIGYIPVIQEGNHQHVHHVLIYECHIKDSARHYEKWLDVKGAQCFGANMPVSWTRCSNPIVAWAIGGDGELMPENVGLPLGEEHGGATYFLMEIHYDNPNLKEGVVDSSGIRIFHTEKLREQEAGIIMLGHSVSPFQMVPPNTEWLSVGHCDSSCTEKELPKDGINVFQGLLHAHLLGKEITLRQIRGGKELPTQFKDANYDFNYQQVRRLKDEMTILPGDFLVTECKYDASKKSVPTFGGFGTEEEMCLIFLTYYPRVNLSVCVSQPALDELLDGLDVEDIYNKEMIMKKLAEEGSTIDEEAETKMAEEMGGDNYKPRLGEVALSQMLRGVIAKSPQKYANMSLYDILHDKATWEEGIVNHLQKEVERGEHVGFCMRRDTERMNQPSKEEIEYPEFEVFKPNMDGCRSESQAESSEGSVGMPPPEMTLMHRAVLDQKGEFVMLWTPGEEDIVFEVQAATKGYIGLGFSPNGGMKGADIVLGWVTDDGKVMMQDRYATGYTVPMKDSSQDVKLLGGYQNETHTVLRFSRPWTSCDDEDFMLSGDTVRLIWAIGDEDPSGEDKILMHDKRGTKSMFLREPRFSLPEFGEDVKTWDVLAPNVTLPNNISTLYWCQLIKMPQLTRKNHVIGFVPVIQEGNHQHVHHILLYECRIEDSAQHYEKWLDVQGAQCYGANMPLSWKKCSNPLVVWAIGGEGEVFPENVGFPLGEEHGGATYFLMETHYDNPKLKGGVVDSSGLRIFHTENLREYDAGILMMGHAVSPLQIVPPNNKWLTVGHCSADCTNTAIPEGGVSVFQGVLHSHLLGRELYLRHIRDGKELPMMVKDGSYDFNYQQTRIFEKEWKILPGDSFITECHYDATKRSVPTFGGFGTTEEMCIAFLAYYPRVNLSTCASHPEIEEILDGIGVEESEGALKLLEIFLGDGGALDMEAEAKLASEMKRGNYTPKLDNMEMFQALRIIIAKSPEKYANVSLYDILHDEETWKESVVSHLQREVERGKHNAYCLMNDNTLPENQDIISYPEFEALKTVNPCKPEEETEPSEGSVGMLLPDMTLMHRAVLDQKGEFVMLWTPGEEDIVFEVQAATKGYIGLGFSPNGGMKGADIVLGWVTDDGKVMMQDRYATGYTVPMKDSSQDVKLLGGYQNETHTVLRFSRPWTSCDEEDFMLSGDTVRLIWAIGDEDPSGEDRILMHDKRGTKSMFLREPRFSLPEFGEDVKTWDVLAPNVTLPNNITTLYWCQLIKMPQLTRKNHVIGFVPVIQEGNHQHVHHILLYECRIEDSAQHYEKWLDVQGAQCYGANMPLSWKKCSNPLVVWAIGGEGEVFPENVGFPLGEEHGGATYFLMETHYDNPKLKGGVVDSSGLRIFHTENLREYDAGILMMGHAVSPLQIVPPNNKWLTVGHCSADCTNTALPEGGVSVFQGVLHSHLLGRELYLRHIRDGKELPMMMKDGSYDFNYQQTRIFEKEWKILPGDSFITECHYDATKRSVPTFGGFGTTEEMCIAFLAYYPRVNLSTCASHPEIEDILDGIGVEESEGALKLLEIFLGDGGALDMEAEAKLASEMKGGNYTPKLDNVEMFQALRIIIAKSPEKYANVSLYDILHDEETWKESVVSHLQREVERGKHNAYCIMNDNTLSENQDIISYPEFEALKSVNPCKSEEEEEEASNPSRETSSLPDMDFMHRVVLDQKGDYVMLWSPNDDEVVFEVQVETTGYVGLGFSPNGGMEGADVVLGWVTGEGKVMLQDRYATGYSTPKKDTSQDVELLGGYENTTHTVLRFSRPWMTCDKEQDMDLTTDTMRIIWAYGYEDPTDETRLRMHDERGTKSLYLKEPRFVLPTFGPDVKTWDVLSSNVALPDDVDTLYWCKLFKIPKLERKTHVIGYVPVIQEENFEHVHHAVLYECYLEDSETHFEKWLDVEGAQCHSPNMPPSWNRCSAPLVAWAIGSDGEMFPDHVGFPLGEEHGAATYFLMEMHYDNPKLKSGVVDSSGLRLFYTENLREYDAGTLIVGVDVTPLSIVPPKYNWLSIGHCTSDCTSEKIPAGGINVFQGLLHAHLLGRELHLRQIRDGQELPPMFSDKNYDFNYQQTRVLKEEMEILPGDSFITECRYDSMKRSKPTFGGLGTNEEMCLAFLSYYPRQKLYYCVSKPDTKSVLDALGVEDIYNREAILETNPEEEDTEGNPIDTEKENALLETIKNQEKPSVTAMEFVKMLGGIVAKAPEKYFNVSLYDILVNEKTWQDKDLVDALQYESVFGTHSPKCVDIGSNIGKESALKMEYPQFTEYVKEDTVCDKQSEGNDEQTGFFPSGRPPKPQGSKINLRKMLCPSPLPICKRPVWTPSVLGNRPIFL